MSERGFTLLELVLTLFLIGVLSSIALPRLVELGSPARVAAVNSLSSSIVTTANLLRQKCLLDKSGCDTNARMSSLAYGGVSYGMNYGWIGAGTGIGTGLIDSAIQYSGFTVAIANPRTTFSMPSAKNPSMCSVVYGNAWATGSYSIQVNTSGC